MLILYLMFAHFNEEGFTSRDDFKEAYCGEWKSEEEFSLILSKLLRGRTTHHRHVTLYNVSGYLDYKRCVYDLFMTVYRTANT